MRLYRRHYRGGKEYSYPVTAGAIEKAIERASKVPADGAVYTATARGGRDRYSSERTDKCDTADRERTVISTRGDIFCFITNAG